MRVRAWIVTCAILAGVATASRATGPESPDSGCGHIEEALAAKRALARGDSKEALEHLRKADALLEQCLRDGHPAQPRMEGERSETETG